MESAKAVVHQWMDDRPTFSFAVNWKDLSVLGGLYGDAYARNARRYYGFRARIMLDTVPTVELQLNFALDDYNVLAVQLIGEECGMGRSCSLSLTQDGDMQAVKKLDIILNNLTGFRWKEPIVHELRAPK
jgi:hypothetical protein